MVLNLSYFLPKYSPYLGTALWFIQGCPLPSWRNAFYVFLHPIHPELQACFPRILSTGKHSGYWWFHVLFTRYNVPCQLKYFGAKIPTAMILMGPCSVLCKVGGGNIRGQDGVWLILACTL